MIRPRVIPCLLLLGDRLVKTSRFSKPEYLGDPVNVARLFNDKEVDELVILDISATVERRAPRFDLLREMASECFMPIAYGGGIRTVEDAIRCLQLGIEKVVLNAAAVEIPDVVTQIAEATGSQAVIVSIDAKKKFFGGYEVCVRNARKRTGLDPVAHAVEAERLGAGEILLTAVDREGTMSGYDIDLSARVASAVTVPVIAHGGAGSIDDVGAVIRSGASAAAAGSVFVFHGPHRAVLISYFPPATLGDIVAGQGAKP